MYNCGNQMTIYNIWLLYLYYNRVNELLKEYNSSE